MWSLRISKKIFGHLIRPSGGLEEFLKIFCPSYTPFGRTWRISKKPSNHLFALRAILKTTVENFDPFIRPSGGLEESLKNPRSSYPPFWRSWRISKNFDLLICPSGDLEESLKELRSSYPPFDRSRRIPRNTSALLSAFRAVLENLKKLQPSNTLLKHQPYHLSFRWFSNIPFKDPRDGFGFVPRDSAGKLFPSLVIFRDQKISFWKLY